MASAFEDTDFNVSVQLQEILLVFGLKIIENPNDKEYFKKHIWV